MSESIPPAILSAIEEGRAILFLGAGASFDALLNTLPTKITVDKVKEALCDRFLGGGFKGKSLMTVADFARNEDSLAAVQSEIYKLFKDLSPNTFHALVPEFRWKAIVTTNYDLVVERSYENNPSRLQELYPVTKDGDQLQAALSTQNAVPYLKLHGCINNYTDTTVPIVLDSLEYTKFTQGRTNLVTTFKEWALNHPIIFCGYSLSDENIKQILFDLGDSSQNRPLYLYVSPNLEEIEKRYWNHRRIAPFSGYYSDALKYANDNISKNNRALATLLKEENPEILRWIPSKNRPSDQLLQYLAEELVHVTPNPPAFKGAIAEDFFSGLDTSFSPLYSNLDIRRLHVNELLERVVLDTLKSSKPKLFILKGYAGSGKSVIAKRLALETSGLIDHPFTIYMPEGAVFRPELLMELQQLVASRVYIFIDDLIEYGETLPAFIEKIQVSELPITILACARSNEFSSIQGTFAKKITAEFEIGDLLPEEVQKLLSILSDNKLLGPLKDYSEAERDLFADKFYGRQLLVALHEITKGLPFEEIIVDEFEKINDREAQQLYLDICTLHQCRVGVRAGLLSRLNKISLDQLQEHLYASLSQVIRKNFDHKYRDIVYRSRHEEISRMVFNLAIQTSELRAFQLKRIVGALDLNYSSDNKAFYELIRGKRLADEFEDKMDAISIFEAASLVGASNAYLNHQRAILELNHTNGNLDEANSLLKAAELDARSEGRSDHSILHTKANLLRRRANMSTKKVERDRYRADARIILLPQQNQRDSSYAETLYGHILLDEIKDLIDSGQDSQGMTDSQIRLIGDLSALLDKALYQRPGDNSIALLRADFLKTLGKNSLALSFLETHCKKNLASPVVLRVLADAMIKAERPLDAVEVIKPALITSPTDKSLNLTMAKTLMAAAEYANGELILTHLRRSFSDGDSNYESRLLFARSNLLYGDVAKGQAEFDSLRKLYIDNRDQIRAMVRETDGTIRKFTGKITAKQAGHGFISCTELRFKIFMHISRTNVPWSQLSVGTKVEFALGFNFRGPAVKDIEIVSIEGK
ncbi:SIR2 family protein [Delftia acidovorans]